MHILIAVITAIAGLVWALYSLQNAGVDLNSFNPFSWARRRRWEKKLGVKPIHGLTDTMEAAALLVVSVALEDGEITRDTKLEILEMFENTFGISRAQSSELFSSSSYLLKDVMDMSAEVRHVLKPTIEQFTTDQIDKLLGMMQDASQMENRSSERQRNIIEAASNEFKVSQPVPKTW